MRKIKNKKGSILAYSLIILATMLAIAGSVSSAVILQKKSAGASRTSAQSFQLADSAAQMAVKKINAVLKTENNKLSNAFPTGTVEKCQVIDGLAAVNVQVDSSTNYKLNFYGSDGVTGITTCEESVTAVKQIKSSASFRSTTRVVMVTIGSADSNTKLLVHADGANNSTTFLDSSNYEKAITSKNGAKISTANHVFSSGGSAFFDGTNDYLQLQDSPDWNFGSGDFTVEFWEMNSSTNTRQHALSFGGNGVKNLDFGFNDPNNCDGTPKGIWVYWNGGGTNKVCYGATNAYTNGAWHHIALVRKTGVITLYIDGQKVGSANYAGNIDLTGGKYSIGSLSDGSKYFWKGNLDEIRVSNVARWIGNFETNKMPY